MRPVDPVLPIVNEDRYVVRGTCNYLSNDTDEELLSLYANRYCKIDYLSWFYNQRQPATLRATDLVYPAVIARSRIHAEWESRMGIFYTAIACIAAINRKLLEAGFEVTELTRCAGSLEEHFKSITGGVGIA